MIVGYRIRNPTKVCPPQKVVLPRLARVLRHHFDISDIAVVEHIQHFVDVEAGSWRSQKALAESTLSKPKSTRAYGLIIFSPPPALSNKNTWTTEVHKIYQKIFEDNYGGWLWSCS